MALTWHGIAGASGCSDGQGGSSRKEDMLRKTWQQVQVQLESPSRFPLRQRKITADTLMDPCPCMIQSKEEKHFIRNHLTFLVKYRRDAKTDLARIVAVEVKPFRLI